jgi:hypothetical protein
MDWSASFRSFPLVGRMMKTSRPGPCQRPPHAFAARSLASSRFARIISISISSKTGKAAMAPALPSAHVGFEADLSCGHGRLDALADDQAVRDAFVGVQLDGRAGGAEHALIDLFSVS